MNWYDASATVDSLPVPVEFGSNAQAVRNRDTEGATVIMSAHIGRTATRVSEPAKT